MVCVDGFADDSGEKGGVGRRLDVASAIFTSLSAEAAFRLILLFVLMLCSPKMPSADAVGGANCELPVRRVKPVVDLGVDDTGRRCFELVMRVAFFISPERGEPGCCEARGVVGCPSGLTSGSLRRTPKTLLMKPTKPMASAVRELTGLCGL